MKNRYTVFLLYSCAVLLLIVAAVQVYGLSEYSAAGQAADAAQVRGEVRTLQIVTLILSVTAASLLLSREEINRGLKRRAYTDVTGIMNKHACLEKMSALDCNDSTLDIGFVMFDLNNLKKVNDFYGHEEGDRLIQSFVLILRQACGGKCFLGRFGGDEFVAIVESCSQEAMDGYLARVRALTEEFNVGRSIRLSYACGCAISTREHYYLMDELLKEADKRMYENKKAVKSAELFSLGRISEILDLEKNGSAGRDELTSLYDYESFVAVVGRVLRAGDSSSRLAVIRSDLSSFGRLNDAHGHKEGNNVLRLFASEASAQTFCLCACRMYADHFAFLADFSGLTEGEALQRVRRWGEKFSRWVAGAYKGSRVTVKSGVYWIAEPGISVEDMLSRAQCAHKAARDSHCDVRLYCEELGRAEGRRAELAGAFRGALAGDAFRVYVQPQVRRDDKTVCGAEALVRWLRPDGGMYAPDEFIPVLEQSGDIVELDFWVYGQVFAFQYRHHLRDLRPVPLSVNVSRVHLSDVDRFVARLKALHAACPVPASLVVFELTESAYIQEINQAQIFIGRLHELGFRVSMDDFGNGYSSLKELQSTAFDEIKLDKAFLRHSPAEREDSLFLHIVSLVKRLGVPVVCEGAETPEHVALLERAACDVIQGYYYYRPFPLERLYREGALPALPPRCDSSPMCG